jgi:hypothetical protein
MQMLTANTDNVAFTTTQSSTAPDGFANSLKVDITTAETTLDSNELFRLLHKIEGQDLQHLNYGSSAAKSVTLSFYVRSNVTGIYAVEFRLNASGTSTITKQYTISSADTWERKELTLPANTATAISNNNSNGFEISFALAAGSNFTTGALGTSWATTATESRYAGHAANVMSSTSNEWYITGVQLEVGEQATPFDHSESYGETLARCQRYYHRLDSANGNGNYLRYNNHRATSTTGSAGTYHLPVKMRATPSIGTTGTASDYALAQPGGNTTCSSTPAISGDGSGPALVSLDANVSSGLTAGHAVQLMSNNNKTSFIAFDAEL